MPFKIQIPDSLQTLLLDFGVATINEEGKFRLPPEIVGAKFNPLRGVGNANTSQFFGVVNEATNIHIPILKCVINVFL